MSRYLRSLLVLSISALLISACGKPTALNVAFPLHAPKDIGDKIPLFAAEVSKMSTEKIAVTPVTSVPTGEGSPDLLESIRSGQIQGAVIPSNKLAGTVPTLSLFSIPFLFRSQDHLGKVMDGPIAAELLLDVTAKTDLVALTFFDENLHVIVSLDQSLNTPTRLQGKKAGIITDEIDQNLAEELGLSVINLPPDEIVKSLSAGTIDVYLGEASYLLPFNNPEQNLYILPTEHLCNPWILVVSSTFWNGITVDDRTLITKACSVLRQTNSKDSPGGFNKANFQTLEIDKKTFAARSARLQRASEGELIKDLTTRISATE